MKPGDTVTIHDPRATYHGEQGTIVSIKSGPFPYRVEMQAGTFWFTAEEVHPTASPEMGHDFDKGFGIGGLGRHAEEPIIPTVEQMKRIETAEAKMQTCRRCRQSDLYDGAMFTTDPSSGLCDDCYG